MGKWFLLGLIHTVIGYEAFCLGLIKSSGGQAAEAMLIIAFICFTVAVILAVLQQIGELQGNFPAQISTIVLIFVAALFGIIGVCIWGAKDSGISWQDPYSACLDCCGALMAIVAGVFLCLELTGGGGGGAPKTNPSA